MGEETSGIVKCFLQVTTKSGKVRKTGEKGGEGSTKRKKAKACNNADAANSIDGEKENCNQGFMSAANFLGREKAAPAPPARKPQGHFFKRK